MKYALISVYDKENIVEFARELKNFKYEIISTSKTAKLLRESNINAKEISEITNFPEILDGRVKTLHPLIFGSLLADKTNIKHKEEIEKFNLKNIEIVVVNLYPFEKIIARDHTLEEAIENIDIGGVSLIRAAAKNYKNIAIVTDKRDYEKVIEELKKGEISTNFKKNLAIKSFAYISNYDIMIYNYFSNLNKNLFPENLFLSYKKVRDLRYGENPQQKASLYIENNKNINELGEILGEGRELSYNNILDINAAFKIVQDFKQPCCSIIKHTNPCSVAIGDNIEEAFFKAIKSDPLSAYGGIYGFNRKVTKNIAEGLKNFFVECIVAPDYEEEALEILKTKKKLRIIKKNLEKRKNIEIRKIGNVLLIQEEDNIENEEEIIKKCIEERVVTNKKPDEDKIEDIIFAWKLTKFVKSNGIVIAKNKRVVGIGEGQTSRVFAVEIAVKKAGKNAEDAVLASDAFFPFRDGIDEAAKGKISTIIQSGGSIRDKEVIEAANEHNMAMIFTGIRHFTH